MMDVNPGKTDLVPVNNFQVRFGNGREMADGQMLRQQNAMYDFDLFVIGGGSGGLACAMEAARFEQRVAIADYSVPSKNGKTRGLGGTFVNVGFVPKKLMRQAVLIGKSIVGSSCNGWNGPTERSHDWCQMIEYIQNHIHDLNKGYESQLEKQNIKYYNKLATFVDKNTLKLVDDCGEEEIVTSNNIVLAMGGQQIYPDVPGAKENCIKCDELFTLPYGPGKTLIYGTSSISLECAGLVHGLGYNVSVMGNSVNLDGFDKEMTNKLVESMRDDGIKFLMQHKLCEVKKSEEGEPGKIRVTYKNADGDERTGEYNTILLATGREPNTRSAGLLKVSININPTSGHVITYSNDETNVDNIYAIGFIADGKPQIPSVSIHAGKLLARRLFYGSFENCEYGIVPNTILTPLEYACCGYTEDAAVATFGEGNVDVFRVNVAPLEVLLKKPLSNECCTKVITHISDDNRVIGIHIIGSNAGDLIQGFPFALKCGLTKDDFEKLTGTHTTNAEIISAMVNSRSLSGDVTDDSGILSS